MYNNITENKQTQDEALARLRALHLARAEQPPLPAPRRSSITCVYVCVYIYIYI